MDGNLIKIRRGEVEHEISLLKQQMDALTAELGELDIAERVFGRLTGAERPPAREDDERDATASSSGDQAAPRPTVRQMILEALMDARQRGVEGLAPKQMREYIARVYGVDIGQQVNTNASRMLHELKEIEKDEITGLFSLPSKDKADGDLLGDATPSAFD